MALEPRRIPFSEFSDDLDLIIERILADDETIVVEKEDGKLILVTPVTSVVKTEADLAAFLSTAGGRSNVDDEAFIAANRESRDLL